MFTSAHGVVMPLNMHRACRDERLPPCCPTSTTKHIKTFSCAKIHGLDSVLCRDVTRKVKFGLYINLNIIAYQH